MYLRRALIIVIITSFICIPLIRTIYATNNLDSTYRSNYLSKKKINKIERFVKREMKISRIPGISIVVVKGDAIIYKRGFGFADLKKKQPVTSNTLFELGSTSKAFTGLGILQLSARGLININDPVTKYIPWFRMMYIQKEKNPTIEKLNEYKYIPWFKQRKEGKITIIQLLRHTSGIPANTIADIPALQDENALEKTIRKILYKDLISKPGEKYQYSTINYDVLGLIIERVTGQKYENYMAESLFKPLGLNNTYLCRKDIKHNIATGYKIGFLHPLPFKAPIYRGNTPAGYIISNGEDLAKWLMIQLDSVGLSCFYKDLIELSHRDNYPYTYGWNLIQTSNGEIIQHSGSNPNFSSYIELRPQQQLGVAILSNLNSGYSQEIGKGIMAIILNRGRIPESSFDLYKTIDIISVYFICFFLLIFLIAVSAIRNRLRKKKQYIGVTLKNRTYLILWSLLFIIIFMGVYLLPELMFGYLWSFILVWAPISYTIAVSMGFIDCLMGMFYLFNVLFVEKNNCKH